MEKHYSLNCVLTFSGGIPRSEEDMLGSSVSFHLTHG